MASVLQKLITPLFNGPVEPPRNKVTVVGVGQVGMACAVSILLQVRLVDLCTISSLYTAAIPVFVCLFVVFYCLHQFHGYDLYKLI